jgi:hypothetical protein
MSSCHLASGLLWDLSRTLHFTFGSQDAAKAKKECKNIQQAGFPDGHPL